MIKYLYNLLSFVLIGVNYSGIRYVLWRPRSLKYVHSEHDRIVYLTESHIIQRNQSCFGQTSFSTKNKLEFSEFTAYETQNSTIVIADIDFLEILSVRPSI